MVKQRARGLTIVEIVVFSAILLGLMVILTTFLVKGKQYAHQTESYGFAQREATKIIRKISDDLYGGVNDHFQLNGQAFYFLSSRSMDDGPPVEFDPGTGGTLLKSWVHYSYDQGSRAVVRSTVPLDIPVSDLTTPPSPVVNFASFAGLPPADVKPIGKGVESLTIIPAGLAVYTVAVRTRFNGSNAQTDPNGNFAEVTLTSTVRLPKHET